MRALLLLFALNCTLNVILGSSAGAADVVSSKAVPKEIPEANWDYVAKQMKLSKFSSPFIKEMKKDYETKDFEEVVRLNVLLFLKKSDYHGVQVTDQAADDVAGFVKEHAKTLKKAEALYKVPAPVIASLLWIESRYGKNLGRFHVPSVYLHLLQAPRKDVQQYLLTQTDRYTDKVTKLQRKKIISRTHDKAKFAIGELKALEHAYNWKWDLESDFRGSFSGAFGMPQFLPSSYIYYARALKPGDQPELTEPDDAVMSVAYYLRAHGWRQKKASHLKALMAYNNSQDYANAILLLASKITKQIQ